MLFDVPIAAITLIDRDRQWFKSKQGLDIESTPRQDAFCDVTIRKSELFVMDHASTDPFFSQNRFVKGDPNIEFYAGFPLEVQGQRLGALCIMDNRTHTLSPEQAVTLQDLAEWVQVELQRDEERVRATEIHHALMPLPLAPIDGYQVAGICVPSSAVGGDFFTWSRTDTDSLNVTLADVMGKGVAAAVIMASVRAALMTITRGPSLVASITDIADALLESLERTGAYVTLFDARISLDTGDIEYVDAGLGLAVIAHEDGTFSRLETRGLPLGVVADAQWLVGRAKLEPGDTLIVISDGLWEVFGGDVAARDEIINRVRSNEVLDDAVRSLVSETRESETRDDVTIVAVRRDRSK